MEKVDPIADIVKSTWTDAVLAGLDGSARGFRVPTDTEQPVVVITTRAVGPKLDVARRANQFDGIGHDLVAATVDDLAAAGARPVAVSSHLNLAGIPPQHHERLVRSIAEACRIAGCVYLGGGPGEGRSQEVSGTVEMVATAVGMADESALITGESVRPGDILIGLESPNLGTTGFELIGSGGPAIDLDQPFPGIDGTAGEVLLEPSVIYAPAVMAAVEIGAVHGLAHVIGNGVGPALARALRGGVAAEIDPSTWVVPDIFRRVQDRISFNDEEMFRAFTMGIGFVVIVEAEYAEPVVAVLVEYGRAARFIGEIVPGGGPPL